MFNWQIIDRAAAKGVLAGSTLTGFVIRNVTYYWGVEDNGNIIKMGRSETLEQAQRDAGNYAHGLLCDARVAA